LDAGTGLSALPDLLGSAAFVGRIVLSHLHWDHVQGLPFCASVDRPDARVELLIPVQCAGQDPASLLSRAFSPPHFPIGPEGLHGDWRFVPLREGAVDETITVAPVPHKGGTAFGIRVALDGATFAYLPDHALHRETSAPDRASARQLAQGADLLIHDGQFLAAQEDIAVDFGHATVEEVLRFADECRVAAVALTHHGPTRTDDELDAIAARFPRTPGGRPVTFARQGVPIDVVPHAAE
jgi:ribonuclease BN (tRNA processing enzyme)